MVSCSSVGTELAHADLNWCESEPRYGLPVLSELTSAKAASASRHASAMRPISPSSLTRRSTSISPPTGMSVGSSVLSNRWNC
jgi:hypothetical protein